MKRVTIRVSEREETEGEETHDFRRKEAGQEKARREREGERSIY